MIITDSQIENFWAKVVRRPGCWGWAGGTTTFGYGVLFTGSKADGTKKNEGAHRISWYLHHGPIPDGMQVCHHCDTPGCTNPDHLFLGTAADNLRDMREKGRHAHGETHGLVKHPGAAARGEQNGNARLTKQDVRQIRRLRAAGHTSKELGKRFGVDPLHVAGIVRRRYWKHVP